MDTIKVLIVDDQLVFRSFLSNAIQDDPEIEVVGTSMHGKAALSAIPIVKPDVVTLDVEMPEMNGIDTLKEIKKRHPEIQVIMVSSHTADGADTTLEALSLGATDFILKEDPKIQNFSEKAAKLKEKVTFKIKRAFKNRESFNLLKTMEPLVLDKSKMADSAKTLILPGTKPAAFILCCEECYLGNILLLLKQLKFNIGVPVIFKILAPDFFLSGMIASFERGNSLFRYSIPTDNVNFEKDNIYLLGEYQQLKILHSKTQFIGKIESQESHVSLNDFLSSLEEAKLKNTPIFMIGNDPNGDGITKFIRMTQNGIPTVFSTVDVRQFESMENELASKIIGVHVLPEFIKKLFTE